MPPHSLRFVAALLALAALSAPVSLYMQHLESRRAARAEASALTRGDPDAGRRAVDRYGCGSCHKIAGVEGAEGQVGPALSGLGKRAEIAGRLSNDPEALVRWIRNPQEVAPGVGMPDLGVTERDGRDIAAYLTSAQ